MARSRIPREAEEHIGACKVCSARLHDYTAMSVELQRAANAIQTDEITIPQWPMAGVAVQILAERFGDYADSEDSRLG